jgi:hypothetical protein
VIRLPENSAPEHEKLAMGPWRTPERVLTGHLYDQSPNLTGSPWAATSSATR